MSVDYDAYAMVGATLSELSDTNIGKHILKVKESGIDDWTEEFVYSVIPSSYYTNDPEYFVGFSVENKSPDEIKEIFDKFKTIFGVDGKLTAWLLVW